MGEISLGLVGMGVLLIVMFVIGLTYYVMSKTMDTIVSFIKSFIKFHVAKRRHDVYWDYFDED